MGRPSNFWKALGYPAGIPWWSEVSTDAQSYSSSRKSWKSFENTRDTSDHFISCSHACYAEWNFIASVCTLKCTCWKNNLGCTRTAVFLDIRECHCSLMLTCTYHIYKTAQNKSIWHLQFLVSCGRFTSSQAPQRLLSHRLIVVPSKKMRLNTKTC